MVELATKRDLEISFLWLRPLRRWTARPLHKGGSGKDCRRDCGSLMNGPGT
jgi:hypothetical protein